MAKKSKAASIGDQVYRLKVTLAGAKPPIWRRIELRDCTLKELDLIVQEAMGWTNSHLHTFEALGATYGDPDPDWDVEDEGKLRLSEIVGEGLKKFRYTYDMGDNWEHVLQVEKPVPAEEGANYPRCVGGARACPPEDCGGVWGYADLLEVLADPGNEEHEERLEWLGGEFDPEAFDLEETNRRLAALGKRRRRR
jgi:hypothetical protein